MKVSVIGTGYVGLVSGVCLAEKGHNVVCIDVDRKKVDNINKGIPPIFERNLEKLLKRNINVNLKADSDLFRAVLETDLSLIAVGTPFDGDRIDLSHIEMVSCDIGKALSGKKTYHMVVIKSTVVPGTTDEVVLPLLEKHSGKRAGIDFGIGMNPEFLREGEAVMDFMSPDRIVMGAIDEKALEYLEELYRPFENVDKVRTNNKTAEMIKYTSNSLLATMISFSNEIANLCTALGDIDVVDVMKAVHLDRRLSPIMADGKRIKPALTTYIEAGCGFGGSCFPKDVKALIAHGKQLGRPMQILDAVVRVNHQQPQQVLLKLKKHFSSLKGVRIAILGLAFKPGTDDMRESPAIPIINHLLSQGVEINAYDPAARDAAKKQFGDRNIVYCDTLRQSLEEVEAVVLLTRWEEFGEIPDLLDNLDPQPLFIDGRRMLSKSGIARYEGIGL
jgi:UDPglucose 6-dehydrogenase/GDP-mannose 6-dehydrogenase